MSEIIGNMPILVNNSTIREGVDLNGRLHTVVTSKTLPFDIVMNGIVYPKEEIEATYHMLDETPAPVGHPKNAMGNLISAKTQEGRNLSDIGAWNRNPKIVGNRVELETWIDIERAKLTAEGREVLERIQKREPISTSVAVIANVEEVSGKKIARIKDYDHNAILLEEPPAAGLEKGVGLMANTSNIIKEVYNAVMANFKGQGLIVNEEENKMAEVTKEDFNRLHESVGELLSLFKEKFAKKEEEVLANEKLNEKVDKITDLLLANSNKELESKRAKVAVILGNEDAVKGMDNLALDAIIAKSGGDHKILGNSAGQKPKGDDPRGFVSAWEKKDG